MKKALNALKIAVVAGSISLISLPAWAGYGPGNGTGNGGNGPKDGTGYGPGTCQIEQSRVSHHSGHGKAHKAWVKAAGNYHKHRDARLARGGNGNGGNGPGDGTGNGGNGSKDGTGNGPKLGGCVNS